MSVLGDLLRFHGVENDELLDALDWKFRKMEAERGLTREALANAMAMLDGSHRTIEKLMAENAELAKLLAEKEAGK